MSKKKNKSVSVSLEQAQRDSRRYQELLYGEGKIKNNFLGTVSGFNPYIHAPYTFSSVGEPVRELIEVAFTPKPAKPEPPPPPLTPAEQRLAKLKGVLEKVRAIEV